MPIKAVVFDIGGVLEDTPKTGWQAKWDVCLPLTVGEIGRMLLEKGYDQGLNACTEAEWEAALREVSGMTQAQCDEFMDDFWHEYLGTPNTELITYMTGLRPRFKTALLSNSALGARHREQERYKFEDITDLIVYSHEEGISKPDARIYEITWQRLGIQPNEMIFVDDRDYNTIPANELGIYGIVFVDTAQTIADIEACIKAQG